GVDCCLCTERFSNDYHEVSNTEASAKNQLNAALCVAMKNGRAPTDITLDITVTHHDPADTCQPRSRRRGELRREAILRLWRSIVEQTAAWSSTCRGRWWGAATTSTSTHPCPQTNANSSWFLRRLGGREVRSSPTHIIRVANDGGSQRMAARSTHRYTRRFVEETSEKMVSKKMRALILQI
ncbi:unnamed protein product, partial [Ectocarpus sp. 12 AP-2014]